MVLSFCSSFRTRKIHAFHSEKDIQFINGMYSCKESIIVKKILYRYLICKDSTFDAKIKAQT